MASLAPCRIPPFSGLRLYVQFFRSFSSPTKPSRFRREKESNITRSEKVNYNTNISFDEHPDLEHVNYPLVTASDLTACRSPPTCVKMLVRDFIEDSLYNPHYGYFLKQATIFTPREGIFNFTALRDSVEFQEEVARRYGHYQHEGEGPGRQLWHTPTELFKPWYGQAIARCLVSEYLLKYFPYEDLLIYEIGAGNGTLALDILNFLRDEYPDVYDRTRYTIIEISPKMVKVQEEKLKPTHPCVKFVGMSVFHWSSKEPAPCFFLAMEVADNFAHDMVRYDLRTLEPLQGYVSIDEHHDFHTFYTQITDQLISSYLGLCRLLRHPVPVSRILRSSSGLRNFYSTLPFAPNLSKPEYIPTRLVSLLRTLRNHFPRHRLLLSDFSSLPDTIPGFNSPVVQTRYKGATVPCDTLFVNQGWFDIFFPTNFEHLRDIYEYTLSEPHQVANTSHDVTPYPSRISPLSTTSTSLAVGEDFFSSYRPINRRTPLDGVASASGLPVGERESNVFTHREFLETYADLSKTRLRNGENPMLDFYQNAKFLF